MGHSTKQKRFNEKGKSGNEIPKSLCDVRTYDEWTRSGTGLESRDDPCEGPD